MTGNYGGDYAERLGDFGDGFLAIFANDADGLHPTDCAMHIDGREAILGGLIGDVAVAGLFDRYARELFAGFSGRRGACVDDGIHFGLGKFGESLLRLVRPLDGGAGFLDGNEVGIVQTQKAKPRGASRELFLRAGMRTARQNLFDMFVRTRDYVHGNQFSDATRGCCSGIRRGFYGADVAANHHCDVARAYVFFAD